MFRNHICILSKYLWLWSAEVMCSLQHQVTVLQIWDFWQWFVVENECLQQGFSPICTWCIRIIRKLLSSVLRSVFWINWSSVKQIVLTHTIAMEMDGSLDYFFPQFLSPEVMCLKGALCVQPVIWSCGVAVVHND